MIKRMKRFKLFGRTYNVKYVKEIIWVDKTKKKMKEEEHMGEMYSSFQTINVVDQDIVDLNNGDQIKKDIHPESLHQTTCHEIIHAWLDEAGYDKLSKNELLVQSMGNCLSELLRTVEYEKK